MTEQGKQTGVVRISLEGKDGPDRRDRERALAQSYLNQHVVAKQAEATKMLDPEGRGRA